VFTIEFSGLHDQVVAAHHNIK